MVAVLFEYKGSKRTIKCTTSGLVDRICTELDALGHPNASVCCRQSPSSSKGYILQRFSVKWDTFIDVDAAEEVSTGDRLTVVPRPASEKSYGQTAESVISRIKKPTQAEAKALARYFPSTSTSTSTTCSTVRKRPFDPAAESVALPMQKKKKRAVKRPRPANISVIMMKEFSSIIPKGKVRQKLSSKGRILSVSFSRDMSKREMRNKIIR